MLRASTEQSGRRTGFWRDCSAAAAAELALLLPGLVFIALNVTDLSVYIYARMQVDLAAQEAVGAARVLCNDATKLPATTTSCNTTLNATMLAAAQSTHLGTGVTLVSGSLTEKYYCADSTGQLKPDAGYALASPPANCSGVLSGSTAAPGDYISVTASYNYTSVFPGASVASLLPAPIQRRAWIRLK
jgi:Flp pilus assembly protein TadG